jgi:hypothetical protein
MDFDRKTCAAGVKKFIRPLMTDDLSEDPDMEIRLTNNEHHLFVNEIEPGMRTKLEIAVLVKLEDLPKFSDEVRVDEIFIGTKSEHNISDGQHRHGKRNFNKGSQK